MGKHLFDKPNLFFSEKRKRNWKRWKLKRQNSRRVSGMSTLFSWEVSERTQSLKVNSSGSFLFLKLFRYCLFILTSNVLYIIQWSDSLFLTPPPLWEEMLLSIWRCMSIRYPNYFYWNPFIFPRMLSNSMFMKYNFAVNWLYFGGTGFIFKVIAGYS